MEAGSARARAVWEKLQAGGRMGLSVGGRKRVVRRYSPVAGRWVRMVEEARLEHVAVCGREEAKCGEAEVGVDSRQCQSTVVRGEPEGEGASGGRGVDSRQSTVDRGESEGEVASGAGEASPPGPLSLAGEGELRGEGGLESPPHAEEERPVEVEVEAGRSRVLLVEKAGRGRRTEGERWSGTGVASGAGYELRIGMRQAPPYNGKRQPGEAAAAGAGYVAPALQGGRAGSSPHAEELWKGVL